MNAAFKPTGVDEIDAMRRDYAVSPTTSENALRRQTLLMAWVRLLVHRGIEMSDFHEACAAFSQWGPIDASRYGIMDDAYRALQRIQTSPVFIDEVRGAPHTGATAPGTDWPVFQGNLEQSGLTPDPGPATGEVAWAFPIGMSWYAAPAIDNGKVYIASPGVTTLLYCIDEATGETVWRTTQNGLQVYSTPRASSSVVVHEDHVVVRASSGSWEFIEKDKHIYYVDKDTGLVAHQVDADRVDYRRGYAPLGGNDEYIVYPYGRLNLRGSPAFVQMQDTVVVRKANGDPEWTLRVGDMFGEPILAGNLVVAPTNDGRLYALNVSGPQRMAWTFDAGAPLRSTPTIDHDTVYIGAEDGTLYALDVGGGDVRWTCKLNGGEPRAQQLFSRPRTHGDCVYIGSATRELYCIEAASGKVRWTVSTSDWIRSRPVVVGDTVFAAGLDGSVTAVDPGGRTIWTMSVSRHAIFADLVGNENGILVSSSDLFLHSLDLQSGAERWRHSLLECIYEGRRRIPADVVAGGGDYQSPPTVYGGAVLIGGPDRFVHAVDWNSGQELWRFETTGQVSGAVTAQNGKLFFGQQGGNGDMYCVRAADGAPEWTSSVGWIWMTSTPDVDRVYTGTVQGDILALSVDDGRVLWRRPTNGGVYPSPAVSGNRVYTGSWDGYYYALDRDTGGIDWCYCTEGHDYRYGGGPDSAAAILWKGKLICRIIPQTLVALDAATGDEVWRFTDTSRDGLHAGMNATPSGSGHSLFVSTSIDHDGMPCGGRLFCLDDETGSIRWFYTGAGGWTGSSCTPNTVLCGSSTDVFMTCFHTEADAEGHPRVIWRTRVDGIFQESIPAICGDRAFILCSDGHLYAFQ